MPMIYTAEPNKKGIMMKKQSKKLTLNKETLRDLTAQNARAVKGACGTSVGVTVTCAKHCVWQTLKHCK
jgi:hypothetical protein